MVLYGVIPNNKHLYHVLTTSNKMLAYFYNYFILDGFVCKFACCNIKNNNCVKLIHTPKLLVILHCVFIRIRDFKSKLFWNINSIQWDPPIMNAWELNQKKEKSAQYPKHRCLSYQSKRSPYRKLHLHHK